jgi:casein kinase II subunit alpha
MGTKDMYDFIEKYKPEVKEIPLGKIEARTKRSWERFIREENKHLCGRDAIDLLNRMLIFDHSERITPKEALDHPYFDIIKNVN